jgi:uncharacterized protein YkwD
VVAAGLVPTFPAGTATTSAADGVTSLSRDLPGAVAPAGSVGARAHLDKTPIADRMEAHVLARVNKIRRAHDLRPLAARSCPDGYAERWTRYMARHHVLRHQSLDRLLRDCALSNAGENIAVGYPTSAAVMEAWLSSPGHRANILDPTYRWIGVGAYRAHHAWWWTQDFAG